MQPPPAPSEPPPEPPGWVIEATLALVLVVHAGCLGAMTLTARAVPLAFVHVCLVAPLSLGLALFAARSVVRRREGRGRLAALTLLVGASTLSPRFAPGCLERGALRDLAAAGGAAAVVAEGRALLAGWETAGRPAGDVPVGEVGPALTRLGVQVHVTPGKRVRVKSFGAGDFSGFVILPPDRPAEGRPVADGLCWWSDAEHAPR